MGVPPSSINDVKTFRPTSIYIYIYINLKNEIKIKNRYKTTTAQGKVKELCPQLAWLQAYSVE